MLIQLCDHQRFLRDHRLLQDDIGQRNMEHIGKQIRDHRIYTRDDLHNRLSCFITSRDSCQRTNWILSAEFPFVNQLIKEQQYFSITILKMQQNPQSIHKTLLSFHSLSKSNIDQVLVFLDNQFMFLQFTMWVRLFVRTFCCAQACCFPEVSDLHIVSSQFLKGSLTMSATAVSKPFGHVKTK